MHDSSQEQDAVRRKGTWTRRAKWRRNKSRDRSHVKNEGSRRFWRATRNAVIRMLGETEEYRKIVEDVSRGSDIEVERNMQYWVTALQARAGVDKGQMRVMECGLRWAVEARRKGRR